MWSETAQLVCNTPTMIIEGFFLLILLQCHGYTDEKRRYAIVQMKNSREVLRSYALAINHMKQERGGAGAGVSYPPKSHSESSPYANPNNSYATAHEAPYPPHPYTNPQADAPFSKSQPPPISHTDPNNMYTDPKASAPYDQNISRHSSSSSSQSSFTNQEKNRGPYTNDNQRFDDPSRTA
ncbi:unnamed protein product [Ambrosiozyma monospora]|uniref:Unnamed protein product n=1 Tax=Ambrosiozyma monospora TaxID=43982 RepID=A0ACB5THY0_AMBMO|nr:unnamed protein product [Ambrosiozyma monospora]